MRLLCRNGPEPGPLPKMQTVSTTGDAQGNRCFVVGALPVLFFYGVL